MVLGSLRKTMKGRRLRKPRRDFEVSVALNFMYALVSVLLTTFGVYWLGREGAGRYFDVFCPYALICVVQGCAAAAVLVACVDLMYKRKSSPACHSAWVALVPLAQVLDHALFFYVAVSAYLASMGSRRHRDALYQPLRGSGQSRVGPLEDLPEVAAPGERLAVLVAGAAFHAAWCMVSWYLWLLVFKHGAKVRRRARLSRRTERRHLRARRTAQGKGGGGEEEEARHEFAKRKPTELIGLRPSLGTVDPALL